MAHTTRTRITIETRQTVVICSLQNSLASWCTACCDVVVAVPSESLLATLQISPEVLTEMLETGKWHEVEAAAHSRLICGKSMSIDVIKNELRLEGERP